MEARALAFHEALRRAFLTIATAEPQRCRVIAAGQAIEAVEAEVWRHVEPLIEPV
jgi:dTMP kinase